MEPNTFTKQGKALPCEVCDVIVEKWLGGSKQFRNSSSLDYRERQLQTLLIGLYAQEAFSQASGGTGYEQQEQMMLFCTRSFVNHLSSP